MRSEIGSEFWEIPLQTEKNTVFPEACGWFLSGRTALRFVIGEIKKHRRFRSVALPSWCCHTMIEPFLKLGVEVSFYPVYPNENGGLVQDLSCIWGCDGVLLMDYFGHSRPVDRPDFDGVVIRDVTHSLFSGGSKDADYVFGSLRKWAGFQTGGYAWKQEGTFLSRLPEKPDEKYVVMRRQAMEQKAQYISGARHDKAHLELFTRAEEWLEATSGISGAEKQDIAAAQALDVEFLRRCRRENASRLLETVKEWALFPELKADDCPLFVPVLVPDGQRNALRQHLIEKKIYCPVHWPVSALHQLDVRTGRLYQEELSLVCDQRYSGLDMERLCTAVQEFLA